MKNEKAELNRITEQLIRLDDARCSGELDNLNPETPEGRDAVWLFKKYLFDAVISLEKVIKELTAQEDAEYEAAKKIVEDYETKQDR